MALTLWAGFPLTASAAEAPLVFGSMTYTYDEGTDGSTATFANNVLTLHDGAIGTLSGTTTSANLVTEENAEVTLTLKGVTMSNKDAPISLGANSKLTLLLADETQNTLTGKDNNPGIRTTGATLIIDGTGTLTVQGGNPAAGIGGSYGASGGNLTINGGNITASGGVNGAGIGGGKNYGNGGNITINGGTVTANGGGNDNDGGGGAGIGGGGWGGAGGNITINGGIVKANGGGTTYGGAGIGGGSAASSGGGGNVTITGGIIIANGAYSGASIGPGGGNTSPGTIEITGTPIIKANSYINANSTGTVNITNATAIISGPRIIPATINHSVLLADGTVSEKLPTGLTANMPSAPDNGILIGAGSFTLDTDTDPVTVTLNADMTIPDGSMFTVPLGAKLVISDGVTLSIAKGGAIDVFGALDVQTNGTLDVQEGGDFFREPGAIITGDGSCPTEYSGAPVVIETTVVTEDSITIKQPVLASATGQDIEYAFSDTNTLPQNSDYTEVTAGTPETITFNPSTPNRTYYVFARSIAKSPYKTGTPKVLPVYVPYLIDIIFDTQGADQTSITAQNGKLAGETVDTVNTTLTKTDHTFLGWYSAPNGEGTKYTFGEGGTKLSESTGVKFTNEIKTAGTITLYAFWLEGELSECGTLQYIGTPDAVESSGNTIIVKNGADVTIFGTTTNERIEVQEGAKATISLNNVNITNNTPLTLSNGADVTIKLSGSNSLKTTAGNSAGIYAPAGTTLRVTSASGDKSTNGTLDVSSGTNAAGIGGIYNSNSYSGRIASGGDITIDGGTINARGGMYGAGIGGGQYGAGGNIIINGGNVTATGGYQAAGIGGGRSAQGGNIVITGGNVNATGGFGATGASSPFAGAGIGTSGYGGSGVSIAISGGSVISTPGDGGLGMGSPTAKIDITGAPVITVTNGIGKGTVNITDATAIIKGTINVTPTISNSIVLATGTIADMSTEEANGIFPEFDLTIGESGDYTTVTLNENLTISADKTYTIPADVELIVPSGVTLTVADGGALDIFGMLTVQENGALNRNESSDFFLETSGQAAGNGVPSTYSGATVSDIEITAITSDSITIKTPIQTAHFTDQKIEYIASTSADLPSEMWTQLSDNPEATTTISGISPQASLYYIFVRSKESLPYNAGKAKSLPACSVAVTFDTDNGADAPDPQNKYFAQTVDPVTNPTGDTFGGWYSQQNGQGIPYILGEGGTQLSVDNGVSLTGVTGTITLFAYWKEKETCDGLTFTYSAENTGVAEGNANVLTLKDGAAGILTGSSTTARVEVAESAHVTVTLGGVTISNTGDSPFKLNANAHAIIKLQGENSLTAAGTNNEYAGLTLPLGASVTITSAEGDGKTSGTLTAKSEGTEGGNRCGAGIGGKGKTNDGYNDLSTGGNVTINGGTVNAIGGQHSAGIGGGFELGGPATNNRTITITGGIVNATGTGAGAGIGGGHSGSAGIINISGGIVTATKGTGNATVDIGPGGTGGNNGTITLSGASVIEASNGIGGNGATVNITNATAYIKGRITVTPTITNSIVLVNGTLTGKLSSEGANGLLIGSDVTIDTTQTPKTVTLNADLTVQSDATFTIPAGVKVTVPSGKTLDVFGTLDLQADGTLLVDDEADFYTETGATFTDNGTLTGKITGATISEINVTTVTNESITITKPIQTEHFTDQKLEYIASTSSTLPSDGWTQAGDNSDETITISPLDPNKAYYIFARAKAEGNYKAGIAKSGSATTIYLVTVTFNTDGGSAAPVVQNKLSGETVDTVDNPSKAGYIFDSWYYKDIDETEHAFTIGTTKLTVGNGVILANNAGTITLFAKWTAKSVAVTYYRNDGTEATHNGGEAESGIYDEKIAAAPTAPIRAGYTFGGWFKDKAAQNAWTFGVEGTALNEDNGVADANEATPALSLYAKWTANPPQTYVVTVTGGTGGGSFAAGAKVSITANTAVSGKMFDRWTGGVDFADAGSATTSFVMPANAVTVTATYKDTSVVVPPGSQIEEEGDNIKVTLPDGGGSVIVPPGSTVMFGENEGEIEVTLPGDGGTVVVPPGSKVMSGENESEIEVTLPGGGTVIVSPGSTVMSGENEGEIEVTLPGGGRVIVSHGSTVDAKGNVTAPPPPPADGSWLYENGVWKYLVGGEAQTGWLYDTGYKAWFYLGMDGAMQTGWVYDQKDKAWYYLASNGKMVAGKWLHDTDGRWYYLSGNGKMLTGKQTIGGKVYSFKGNGAWVG
jgi:uncharacterized repeat protein (TIGR02543 family)